MWVPLLCLAWCCALQAGLPLYVCVGQKASSSLWIGWISSELDQPLEWGDRAMESLVSSVPGGYIHKVFLSDLSPGTTYSFSVGGETFKVKTPPSRLPLRIADGGDIYQRSMVFEEISKKIAESKPDVVVIGGDLAYTYGSFSFFHKQNDALMRWKTLFRSFASDLKNEKGALIPLVPVMGNHDRDGLFPILFPEGSVQVYDFGSSVSTRVALWVLDTGHIRSVSSQVPWLQETLQKRASVPWKLAAYHKAAFPSVSRPRETTDLRELWVPHFEAGGIALCFEHHNHAYKQTYPLLKGQIDPEGIRYVGDGCWGVRPRVTHAETYLEETGSFRHAYLLKIESRESATLEVLSRSERRPAKTIRPRLPVATQASAVTQVTADIGAGSLN